MYGLQKQAREYAQELLHKLPKVLPCAVKLAVPFTLLQEMSSLVKGSSLIVGAQNMHEAAEGAFTGEISAPMLQEAGAKFVILGHSERRKWFGETGEALAKKVQRALLVGLEPVLCFGETEEEKGSGMTRQVVEEQLLEVLTSLPAELVQRIVLAYEPVWAIGTGKHATGEWAEEIHRFCRNLLASHVGEDVASIVPILYGGSVNEQNIVSFLSQKNIDGALVGGASLRVESFYPLIQSLIQLR